MDIAKILKDCPKGTKLYSPLFGECELVYVDYTHNTIYPIIISVKDCEYSFTKDGFFYREHSNGECMIFPSKHNRDWFTFKVPKKEYDFKPFERVLVRDEKSEVWKADLFSHYYYNTECCYATVCCCYKQCIPYEGNEHLLGTNNNPD